MSRAHHISNWDPEDVAAWEAGNKKIARRNLIWSVFAMHVGYSVWSIWSVMVLFMPRSVYGLSPADKLLLGATATLVGGCLRIPYAVAVTKFGGRNWMVFSSLVLLIPTVGTILLLANPGQPLWMYLVCAALTGMGGGNFSAAIANVNVFYPQRLKGAALGIAGGGGNIGVPVIQIVGLVVLATAGNRQPYWVCAIYLVLLSLAALASALFLGNVELPRGEHKPMRAALVQRDTWILAMLYVATYGSFIGFSFAFGQVLQMNYMATGQGALQASLHAAQVAFLGPLLASLARMYGGRLSVRHDRRRQRADRGEQPRRPPLRPLERNHHDRLHHRFHGLIRLVRHRQRSGVQNDPSDLRGTQPLHERHRSRTPPLGPRDVRRRDRNRRRDRHARRRIDQYGTAAVLPEHRLGDDGILLFLVVLPHWVGADVVDVRTAPRCRQPDPHSCPGGLRIVRVIARQDLWFLTAAWSWSVRRRHAAQRLGCPCSASSTTDPTTL